MKPRIVYVDVDDTLVRSVGSERLPIPAVIARVRALHARGETLYLWSSGGGEYAHATAVELGIEGLFTAFLPKPETYIDDLPAHEWINCELFVADRRGRLLTEGRRCLLFGCLRRKI